MGKANRGRADSWPECNECGGELRKQPMVWRQRGPVCLACYFRGDGEKAVRLQKVLGSRKCCKCGRGLTIEPAIVGLHGWLCFPCRHRLDESGGEAYLERKQLYAERLGSEEAEVGEGWKTSGSPIGWRDLCAWIIGLFWPSEKSVDLPERPSESRQREFARMSCPEALFDCNEDAELERMYLWWPYYPPDWEERRGRCMERDGFRCRLCNEREDLQAHHVVPLVYHRGGHSLQNLITLCERCHTAQRYYGHQDFVARSVEESGQVEFNLPGGEGSPV